MLHHAELRRAYSGKLAVVSGASSGFGAVLTRLLAAAGCRVVAVARREALLHDVLQGAPKGSLALAVDLTEKATAERVRDAVEAAGGRLDLLVNNAGASQRGGWGRTFAELGTAEVERLMQLNFLSHVRLTEALLPALRAAAPSTVVNVSSVAGRVGLAGASAYAASKFALTGWSEALHCEEQPNGVWVSCVYPGFAATEGFPQTDLQADPTTRWLVTDEGTVARAILETAIRGRAERTVPRGYAAVTIARHLAPPLFWKMAPRLRRPR